MLAKLRNGFYYHLPVALQNFVLVTRRWQTWLEAGIVFIHIPKAAGTSINHALYGRFMGHIPAASIRRWAPAAVNALPSFAVARNPWDRLVSAYRFVRAGGGIGGAHPAGVWRPQLYQSAEFDSFERFVKEWLDGRAIGALEYQFQPQWPFVCNSRGDVLVDHVGRVEDLAPTLAFLRDRTGRAPDVPKANRSGESVDYRSYYTPELVDIVGRIYARDADILGYSFEG